MDVRWTIVYAIGLLCGVVGGASADPRIHYSRPDQGSLRLITPDSPEFLSALRGRADSQALAALGPFLPFSVIVKNEDQRSVAAVVVIWSQKNARGEPITNTVVNYTLAGEPRTMLRVEDFWVITPVQALNQAIQSKRFDMIGAANPARQKTILQQYPAQTDIGISLDSIVFEDGELVGPDTAMTATAMNGEIRAHKAVDLALRGMSSDELRQFLVSSSSLELEALKPPPISSPAYSVYEDHCYRRVLRGLSRALLMAANARSGDVAGLQAEARSKPATAYIPEVRRKQRSN